MSPYFHWWNSIRVVAFDLVMLAWIAALRRPLPPMEPGPTLISENVVVGLLREVLAHMRRIAEDMKRIARSRGK